MKKTRLFVFLITSIVLIFPFRITAAQYKNLKQNLAVMDLENKTTSENIGNNVQDILTTILWKSERFILVEREKIEEILKEQDFSQSGRVSAEGAIKIGRILGADYVLTGGITEAGLLKEGGRVVSRAALDIRVVDVTTTQIIIAETAVGEAQGADINMAVRKAAENLIFKINEAVDKKPWQSLVIKTDGQAVYINAGAEHGIQKGDRFAVYKKGEELIDPQTKLAVGYLSQKTGIIEITEVQPKYSVSNIMEGVGFEKGDIVKKE